MSKLRIQGNDLGTGTVLVLGPNSNVDRTVRIPDADGDLIIGVQPAGDFVGTTASQTLTNKTLASPIIEGTVVEDVYTIVDGAAFEIDPSNGSIQLLTLGDNRTPKATNFIAGQSITLMILDGANYTLTWTDTTFGPSGVSWFGGSAPSLDTTKYTVVELYKVGSQVYGILVGTV